MHYYNYSNCFQVPELPNDLMRMIFSELSTRNRAPLGYSCKRFRALDLDVGKKLFIYIGIHWVSILFFKKSDTILNLEL